MPADLTMETVCADCGRKPDHLPGGEGAPLCYACHQKRALKVHLETLRRDGPQTRSMPRGIKAFEMARGVCVCGHEGTLYLAGNALVCRTCFEEYRRTSAKEKSGTTETAARDPRICVVCGNEFGLERGGRAVTCSNEACQKSHFDEHRLEYQRKWRARKKAANVCAQNKKEAP